MRNLRGYAIGATALVALAVYLGLNPFKSSPRQEAERELLQVSKVLQDSPEQSQYLLTPSDIQLLQSRGLLTQASADSLRPLVKN